MAGFGKPMPRLPKPTNPPVGVWQGSEECYPDPDPSVPYLQPARVSKPVIIPKGTSGFQFIGAATGINVSST